MKEKNEHLSKVGNNDISESMQSDIIYGEANSTSNTPQNNMEVAIPQLCDGTRMVPSEVGRSERKVITSNNPVISSLILKNIPEKYKLISQDNCAENQTDYSYQTADGSETISIKLIDLAHQDQAIVAETDPASEKEVSDRLMSAAAPAVAENISREIQVGDQKITVLISCNISSDELNVLANTLIICTDSNK